MDQLLLGRRVIRQRARVRNALRYRAFSQTREHDNMSCQQKGVSAKERVSKRGGE